MNITSILSVATGAALGGVSRFLISEWFKVESTKFPYATCLINLIGSFILGMVFAWSVKFPLSNSVKLFLGTGFCGGFTTFSAFSLEWLRLIQNGHAVLGLTYVLVSVLGGLIFAWVGFRLI
ncbi:MAG: fluoride efflux transporter CrcB [Saprospiraceae bacterium]